MEAGPSKNFPAKPYLEKIKSFVTASSTSATPGTASSTGATTGKGKEPKKSSKKKKDLSPIGSGRSSIASNLNVNDNQNGDAKIPSKKHAKKPSSLQKQEDNKEEKKKPTVADGNLIIAPILPNLPALWVRSADGGIKLLNNAPAAPSAAEPGVRIKAKKNLRGVPKNDQELWAAFELQQQEVKQLEEKRAAKTKRKGIKKSNVIVKIPGKGVHISLDDSSEANRLEAEEINKVLIEQTLKMEKEKKEAEANKAKEEAKKKAALKLANRRLALTHHSHYITHDIYMFHLHQPHLMSPLFELPSERRILFGQFEKNLESFEEKITQKYVHRPMESVFIPENFKAIERNLAIPVKSN